MNKLKVFKNVFGKRTESGFSVKNLGTALLLLLLVPYIITSLFGNASGGNTVQEKERMLEEQLREGGDQSDGPWQGGNSSGDLCGGRTCQNHGTGIGGGGAQGPGCSDPDESGAGGG